MSGDPNALGQLCVERGLLTQPQLEACLEIQRQSKDWRRLGELLIEQGYVTGTGLAQVLSIQEAHRRAIASGEQPRPEAAEPKTELGWLLKEARAYGAHGIVLGPGQPPAFHYCGRVELLEGPALTEEQIIHQLQEALPIWTMTDLGEKGWAQATVEIENREFVRATLYRFAEGIGAVIRPQAPEVADLSSLGLPRGVKNLAEAENGLVLITGPVGSGKTTTMNSLLHAINRRRACHIMTLEDPVRMRFARGHARVSQRSVGRDIEDFTAGLRVAVRSDADVIAVDALENRATIATAVDVASNGRLVIALMNTNGAGATIQRLLDGSATRAVLASCLRGIVTQHLLRAKDDHKVVVAAELLLCTPGIATLIREDRIDQIPNVLHMNRSEGMACLDDALVRLCRKGRITQAEALACATDIDKVRRTLNIRTEVARAGG